jgi:hypothetical protein
MKNKILTLLILISSFFMPYCGFAQNEMICEADTLKAQKLFEDAWK